MATAKSLQKGVIIDITNSMIRVKHPDISKNVRTALNSPIDATGTAMSVYDNMGFADNDYFIVGEIGDSQTEACDVNGAVTRGSSMTVTNTLKFDHELDAPVTKIYETQFKLYGAATDGGTGTAIATVSIEWNKFYTEYTLLTTDTAYAYYYVKYYDGTTEGAASDYVASTGLPSNSVAKMVQMALDETNSRIDNKITYDFLVRAADECQERISQYAYQDPRTGEMVYMNWDFEISRDIATITASTNENEYDLTDLNLKHTQTDNAIINVVFGTSEPLEKIPPREYDEAMADKIRTEVATQATAGDTTLVCDSNIEFADDGTIYAGAYNLTYASLTGTTTFAGIPASGTGAITATIAVDTVVWQNLAPALPTKYTIDAGSLKFTSPVLSDYNGYPIKIRFFKNLTALTEFCDTTDVTFTNVFSSFIAHRIEKRKGNDEKAMIYLDEFNKTVLANALASKPPLTERQKYYNFDDPFHHYDDNDDD